MRPEDFDYIAKMLKERSGLIVTPDKAYLLDSRLMPIARKRGMKDLTELIGVLRNRDEVLAREVTEAMTTNESFFFRDIKPFDQFRDIVLPQMMQARAAKKSLRIWSAASSSGQEPYSLAMILKEQSAKLAGWRIEIVATDISTEMLEKAKAGLYSQFEVQRGLPIQLLVKYFQKREESWQIDASIRAMVQFREWNLLNDLKGLGQFDIVFCRNVLIYFDQPTKTRVLDNIARQMPDDGILYLGGAETVLGVSEAFKPIPNQRGIYAVNRAGIGKAPQGLATATAAPYKPAAPAGR
ncbi:protein-glutamate O-methyltransferase CheR [Telmatospirillum sp. J64-1]|uniref:CheR family methyltransferase n=1 Tax=Telmatospirillum sp. J64-1 TaxID=2502183 RepID=UPI00115C5AC6|nr:protein-glutamate O-methyltransferase [Telmatospirillum sp. J64-1]